MQESLPVLLTIEILDYDKQGSTVFYTIEIMANATKTWTITRKYKDIEDMHKKLIKKLPNMPYLPAKNFFSLGETDLDKRKDDLEKYLNVLASRKDMLSDPEFKNFLDLEKYIKPDHLTVVKELYEISDLPMGVKDFVYLSDKGVLFVLLAETKVVSKIGNFISSISKPSEVSSVIAYKEDPPGSLDFVQLWQHNLKLEGSMLCWNEGLTILAIGHTNGFIECIRVSTELGYTQYSPFCKIQYHTQCITGMILFSESGHLISGSLDKYLTKTDIANDEANLAEKELSHPITCMIMDKSNKRFFVSDSIGTIHIFTPEEKMRCLTTIAFHQENFVKTLFFDKTRSLLIAGSNQGLIVVYEIGKPMREKFSSYSTSFDAVKQIRSLHFIGQNKEIYVANAFGKVAMMNSLTTIPFHILDAHDDEVTQMMYLEDQKLLITSGLDKSIKFWRYPFDPNERIPTRKLQAQKLPTYDYPEIVNTYTGMGASLGYGPGAGTGAGNGGSKSYARAAEPEEDEEEDEYESGPSGKPVTLFQYRPAKDPTEEYDLDSEEEEEENRARRAKAKNDVKKVEDNKRTTKPNLQPLGSDEEYEEYHEPKKEEESEDSEEERVKQAAQASPKSNLFKNSVFEVVKKADTKALEKKQLKADPEKEAKIKAKEQKEREEMENNPLLRTAKPKRVIEHEAPVKSEKKEVKAEKDKKKDENKSKQTEAKTEQKKESTQNKTGEKTKEKEAEKEKDKEKSKEKDGEKEKEIEEKTKDKETKEKEVNEKQEDKSEKQKPVEADKKEGETKKDKEEKPDEEKKQESKPQKEEEKKKESVAKKVPQEKKVEDPLADRPSIIPQKKKPAGDPLAGPGFKKPQKKEDKIPDLDQGIETAKKGEPVVKKKQVKKISLDSDSDDEKLLDFQNLRYTTTANTSSKTSTKKQQKKESEDEDEGLAGWAK